MEDNTYITNFRTRKNAEKQRQCHFWKFKVEQGKRKNSQD